MTNDWQHMVVINAGSKTVSKLLVFWCSYSASEGQQKTLWAELSGWSKRWIVCKRLMSIWWNLNFDRRNCDWPEIWDALRQKHCHIGNPISWSNFGVCKFDPDQRHPGGPPNKGTRPQLWLYRGDTWLSQSVSFLCSIASPSRLASISSFQQRGSGDILIGFVPI